MPLHVQSRHSGLLAAIDSARSALGFARIAPSRRAEALDRIAAALDSSRTTVIDLAAAETALLPAELGPEFDRMTGTLRLFADLLRAGAWARPAVSRRGRPAIGPDHDVRSMLVPLGPVAVFGASNFPLAYGVCGGDTASALAAGCPVVVKEHPAHPKTGRLLFTLAQQGLRAAGVDEHALAYAEHTDPADLAIPNHLVTAEVVRAVGFTGSRRAGLAIHALANQRPMAIPVFAEMGSANPVLITPAAARARAEAIGLELAASILARFGQQCTCPGIIFVPDACGLGAPFVAALSRELAAAPPRPMLAPWIRDAYTRRLAEAAALPDVRFIAGNAEPIGDRAARPAALLTTTDRFAWHAELREEIFGPAALIVDTTQGLLGTPPLPSSLTLTIHFEPSDPADLDLVRGLLAAHADTAGRIVFNGVPTGVRVADGMVHGGPFPVTNRPDTTAVGPRAIERWCRPICWQNAPPDLLPDDLRDPRP
ncbi:MAG: aldehyde dehydrogenase family protein [Phycisphaerales bacterium]